MNECLKKSRVYSDVRCSVSHVAFMRALYSRTCLAIELGFIPICDSPLRLMNGD